MIKIFENLDVNDLDREIWKIIENFPDYQISNFSRIKSLKFGKEKILLQNRNIKNGYFCINLFKNGKSKTKSIHILLYETFSDYKLKKNECVHHKDFIKENNYFDNLIMMSKKEHNILHNKGENHPKGMLNKKHSEKTRKIMSENNPRKLSNQKYIDIVIDIKKEVYTNEEISNKYGVVHSTISKIKKEIIQFNRV